MKRINISYSFMSEFGDLFRPSKHDEIRATLQKAGVYSTKEVCMMSEKEFKQFPFATDYIFKKVQTALEACGLRFGMTEEELTAYEDADYLKAHPEEVELTQEEMEEVKEKVCKKAYSIGNAIRRMMLQQRMHTTLLKAYTSQPWWKKLLMTRTARYKSAVKDATLLCSGIDIYADLAEQIRERAIESLEKQPEATN